MSDGRKPLDPGFMGSKIPKEEKRKHKRVRKSRDESEQSLAEMQAAVEKKDRAVQRSEEGADAEQKRRARKKALQRIKDEGYTRY